MWLNSGSFDKKYLKPISCTIGGVESVELKPRGGLPGFTFDLTGKNQDRLTDGETLPWTLAFKDDEDKALNENSFTSFQARVQNSSALGGSSAKFNSSPA